MNRSTDTRGRCRMADDEGKKLETRTRVCFDIN